MPVRGGVGDLASIYSLNELGSFIWRQLNSPKDLDSLIGMVVDEYDVAENIARDDVQTFLAAIRVNGLIVEVNAEFCAPDDRMQLAEAG